jgi:hypothetical protein
MVKHDEEKLKHETHKNPAPAETQQPQAQTAPQVPQAPQNSQQNGAQPQAAGQAYTGPTDDRYRKVKLDDNGSIFGYNDTSRGGVTVNRIDYIRAAWTVGKRTRGSIAKELSRLTGGKVTYQIVFSATRGIAGGPAVQAPQPIVGGPAPQATQQNPTS